MPVTINELYDEETGPALLPYIFRAEPSLLRKDTSTACERRGAIMQDGRFQP